MKTFFSGASTLLILSALGSCALARGALAVPALMAQQTDAATAQAATAQAATAQAATAQAATAQAATAQAATAQAATAQVATAQVAIAANLRCEYLTDPLSVEASKPRLSWVPQSNARNWKQSAYRVEVASSAANLSANRADLWDSGKVNSAQTVGVRYAGQILQSGQRCFWRVRVWDEKDQPSPASAPQFWQMGLLRQSDWQAAWIGAQTPRDAKNSGLDLPPSPYLRKSFALSKPVARATMWVTARGLYEMHLNGARVGDAMMAPGWTDYNRRIQYQAYDVTAQLKTGANAVGAILGDGWFSGFVGFGGQRDHYGRDIALKMRMEVRFTDGTTQNIVSDPTWQGAMGPLVYSDMLQGEFYDARLEQNGWDTAAFQGKWKNAVVAPETSEVKIVDVTDKLRALVKNGALSVKSGNDLAGDPAYNTVKTLRVEYSLNGVAGTQIVPENETLQLPGAGATGNLRIVKATYGVNEAPGAPAFLVASPAPAVRVTQELAPIKITEPAPRTYIFDMGQNMVGVARLKVRGAAGTKVQMRFAEMLNPDGSAYTANLRGARATDTYVCKGGGIETFEPRFTFHGFRYVEVTGFPGAPNLDAITGLVIGSDIAQTGTFSTSSALVNQLQSNIDWGQRGNFLSVPTDCPQRDERLGWMGDAQVFARTATYNRDVAGFFEKWLQDVKDSQGSDGGYPDVAPRKVDDSNGAPAWGDAGVIVPWTMYQAYGDRDVIDNQWVSMGQWLDYITSVNPDGLWKNRRNNDFGDWLSIGADTDKELLATAYYAHDADLMARMARATGRDAEAAQYSALFEKIKAAFNAAYVGADGKLKGDTQTAYLLALHFDLLPGNLRPLAVGHLADDIKAKDDHLSTGFIGVGYLCPTLSDNGHNDLAYKLLLNETFPSWGYSIKRGATTIWERWDGYTGDKGFQDVGMNSFNHYSLGSVGEWMFGTVGGIQTDPAHPGFERILIAPQPGPGLTFANASYDSVRGRIVSNWKTEANATVYDITVPANTTAQISLPAQHAAQVKESGVAADKAPGVKLVSAQNGVAAFEVGAGVYQFEVAK